MTKRGWSTFDFLVKKVSKNQGWIGYSLFQDKSKEILSSSAEVI
jgi:hypothetical protein